MTIVETGSEAEDDSSGGEGGTDRSDEVAELDAIGRDVECNEGNGTSDIELFAGSVSVAVEDENDSDDGERACEECVDDVKDVDAKRPA